MQPWEKVIVVGEEDLFKDRRQAGERLATAVHRLLPDPVRPVVLGLPRGGIIVAAPVADALSAPLDFVMTKKLGAPGQPELALGAVTERGHVFVNEHLVSVLAISEAHIEAEAERKLQEIKGRTREYRAILPSIELQDTTAILVDDGIATGATMFASVRAVLAERPARIVAALPVAPPPTLQELAKVVDLVIVLMAPAGYFGGVSTYYYDFGQTSDAEALAVLRNFASKS